MTVSNKAASPDAVAPPAGKGRPGTADDTRVDQIRDLIVGAEMAEYDRRFQELEAKLVHEAAQLRSELTQRLDSLAEKLGVTVEHQGSERRRTWQEHGDAMRDLSEVFASTSAQFEKQISELLTSLSGRLDEESVRRAGEVSTVRRELTELLERQMGDLGQRKADRTQIAQLLSNLADDLTDGEPNDDRRSRAGGASDKAPE